MTSEVESALNDVGLATLVLIFISDKVNGNIILAGSDQELMCLGISTIGNRCRLRDISRGRRYYKHNFIQQIEPVLVPSSVVGASQPRFSTVTLKLIQTLTEPTKQNLEYKISNRKLRKGLKTV